MTRSLCLKVVGVSVRPSCEPGEGLVSNSLTGVGQDLLLPSARPTLIGGFVPVYDMWKGGIPGCCGVATLLHGFHFTAGRSQGLEASHGH